MRVKRILLFALIAMLLLTLATIIVYKAEPQMHKTIMLEEIIFKRGK